MADWKASAGRAMDLVEGDVNRPALPEAIVGPRVIAIARGLDPASMARIAEGLLRGGVRAFELTLNSPGALDGIAELVRRFEADGLVVGAGTVMDVEAAGAAIDAGARFLVSPHTDPDLVRWAATRRVPMVPGAFTPTEIVLAWRAGAAAVKLFPASVAGPAFVREHRGPLGHIPLVPSGGMTLENAPAFVAAGAVAVGLGSWLTGDGDPAAIAERARTLLVALAPATP
jgi:2-dehydro-3-deoxyphosphogluconate aldolase / (4S)-4-hydroxy-2-oxoglutarate aldolase